MKHTVILAGGVGTRLWPFSKRNSPKQFHSFLGDNQSLLQATFIRAAKIVGKENVWLVTTKAHKAMCRKQLSKLSPNQIITEPVGRNTAAAIYLAAKVISKKDSQATLAILPSDHYIGLPLEFTKICKMALKICEAEPKQIVTLGIQPTEPNTGYGYVEIGDRHQEIDGTVIEKVKRFREKPDLATAKRFLRSRKFVWNSGCFFVNSLELINNFSRLAPKVQKSVDRYLKDPTTTNYQAVPSVPFDSAVVEIATDRLVIPANIGWSDLGSWEALYQILTEKNGLSNIVIGKHQGIDSGNSLIIGSNKLIATVGIQDAVIIETDEAILVCKRDSVQEVKKLVDKLDEMGQHKLL